MPVILNIHTATETAIVNIAIDKKVVDTLVNEDTREHAAFLHVAIKELMEKNNFDFHKINAVAVTAGPGSYTGIRIGIASAKGLCYSLNIPLIFNNSLELLSFSAASIINDSGALYCAMIDARRMEIFTGIYNYNMKEIVAPSAVIIDEDLFQNLLNDYKIYFCGSGVNKSEKIIKNKNAFFTKENISTESLAITSYKKFNDKNFENVSYAQPLYVKEFHTTSKNK